VKLRTPLERISGTLTNALEGTGWLPDPNRFNFVRVATRRVIILIGVP
jgi:sodium-dependent phosphate cotransporter